VGIIVFSGSVSVVFLLTLSPQTPRGSSRLLVHVAKLQLVITQFSSVHLHQTVLPRKMTAFLPHLNNSQFGEQSFVPAKINTTYSESKHVLFFTVARSFIDKYGYCKCM
jgi:hypothetical protein